MNIRPIAAALLLAAAVQTASAAELKIYDNVVFYDGYRDEVVDADLDDGILRHRNSLYAKKLTDEQLNSIGNRLSLTVTVGALCDNFDRIGNINIAFVPKGQESYSTDEVARIELARFITPFMNKNKQPDEVPYEFDIDNVAYIFHDAAMREAYDYWLEFELFGIPYAANEQVAGCKSRNDVFLGTLVFTTSDEPMADTDAAVTVPIVMKHPEYKGNNFNNYNERATDELGQTIKTWRFTVPADVDDAQVTLIISNHGANAGGEEYVRRVHFVSVDGEELITFTPGGESCEPYRVYNTQGNGIYSTWRSSTWWKLHSNWCPGAAIPIRVLELGALKAGEHAVTISVPQAEFVDGQGDFPVSMYFQGFKGGERPWAGINDVYLSQPEEAGAVMRFEREGDELTLVADGPDTIEQVIIVGMDGRVAMTVAGPVTSVSLSSLAPGSYVAAAYLAGNGCAWTKFVR